MVKKLQKTMGYHMKFLNAILVALPLILGACGKNNSNNQGGTTPSPQVPQKPKDISELALPDALATKYDSVALNCNLWTRMKGPLVITDTPDDTVSIDLIKDSSFPKTINLSSKAEIHSLAVEVRLSEMKLQNGRYSDNFGAQYSFKNSPAIYGEYLGESSTTYPEGYVGGQFQGNSLTINENIVSQVVAQSAGPQGEASPTVDYVECSIVTKVKSTYKDEWKQDTVGNPPSCLLGQPTNPMDCMIRRN